MGQVRVVWRGCVVWIGADEPPVNCAPGGRRIRQPGGQHEPGQNRQHDGGQDQQPNHGADATLLGEGLQIQQPVEAGRDQCCHYGGTGGDQDRPVHLGLEQPASGRAQRSPQQQVAEYCSGHKTESVRGPEVCGHQFGVGGQVRSDQRRHDLHDRDRDDDQDGCPWFVARVEHP